MAIDYYQVSLKTILKNKDHKILALRGAENGTFAGFYDLPGGRIAEDEFETPYPDILSREIKEEIGNHDFRLHSKPVAIGRHQIELKRAGTEDREPRVVYIFFEADYFGGDIHISDEHSGHAWLDLNAINPEQYFKSGILEGVKMYLSH